MNLFFHLKLKKLMVSLWNMAEPLLSSAPFTVFSCPVLLLSLSGSKSKLLLYERKTWRFRFLNVTNLKVPKPCILLFGQQGPPSLVAKKD